MPQCQAIRRQISPTLRLTAEEMLRNRFAPTFRQPISDLDRATQQGCSKFRGNRLFSLTPNPNFLNLNRIELNSIKLEHFRNLVSLSAIDGKIEEVERVALSKIAFEQGLPLDRLNLMLNRASEYIYLIPQNTEEREQQLEEMISLALVDGDFAPAELELIEMVAEKLGFSHKELDQILEAQCGYKR